jgi:uncharacterized protein
MQRGQRDVIVALREKEESFMRHAVEQVSRAQVGIAAALSVGMFLAVRAFFPGLPSPQPADVAVREAVLLLLAGLLVLHVRVVERLPPSELGWRPKLASVGWGVLVCVGLIAAGFVTITAARALGFEQDTQVLRALLHQPAWLLVVVAATAGVTEELAFRAVLIDHLGALLHSRFAGAVLSVLLFSALHVNAWRMTQFFFVLPSAIIITAFYLWKRDLLACIIGHALTDAIGLLSASAAQAH